MIQSLGSSQHATVTHLVNETTLQYINLEGEQPKHARTWCKNALLIENLPMLII